MSDDKPSGEDVKISMTLEEVIKYVRHARLETFGDVSEASHYMDVEEALKFDYEKGISSKLQQLEAENAELKQQIQDCHDNL